MRNVLCRRPWVGDVTGGQTAAAMATVRLVGADAYEFMYGVIFNWHLLPRQTLPGRTRILSAGYLPARCTCLPAL